MSLKRLENIAWAATALTNRQLPYLVNYQHLNALFSKASDRKSEKALQGLPELHIPTTLPHPSALHKNEMKPNISQQRGQYQIHSINLDICREIMFHSFSPQKIKKYLNTIVPLCLLSKMKFTACHTLS